MSKVDEILNYIEPCPGGSHPVHNTPAYGCMNLNEPSYHAKQQLLELMLECVGEDEKHSNGKKIVHAWQCDDCGMPEPAFIRNQNRAEIRTNIHKAFGVDKD